MANVKKITLDWSETGKTVYCIIRRETDSYRLNDADGSFASIPADPYLSLTEDTVIKGRYEVSESRAVWNDGKYTVAVYKQSGGAPIPTSDTIIGSGGMYIVSDVEIIVNADISAIRAKTDNLPDGIKKNTALNNFEFLMLDANNSPKTGLTVTAQRSIDGGVFAACANSAVEVSDGIYKINLAASDLNGDVITLRFSATGANARYITVVTQT